MFIIYPCKHKYRVKSYLHSSENFPAVVIWAEFHIGSFFSQKLDSVHAFGDRYYLCESQNNVYMDKLWRFREEKGGKVQKNLIFYVNYQFQPSNLRAWGPFSYNKVSQFKRFSFYIDKLCM